jgi:hypothetical protein
MNLLHASPGSASAAAFAGKRSMKARAFTSAHKAASSKPSGRAPTHASPLAAAALAAAAAGAAATSAAQPHSQRRPRTRLVSAASTAGDGSGSSAATAGGRMTYRPESYSELVGDAAAAMLQAVNAGVTRMEVEFPPIPTNIDGARSLISS